MPVYYVQLAATDDDGQPITSGESYDFPAVLGERLVAEGKALPWDGEATAVRLPPAPPAPPPEE